MRLKLVAVAGLFALSATGSVQAMEMRQKDADDFRAGLLSSFPDLANSDFLTVKPAGDRLEITLDFNSFFDGLDPKAFRMTGFGPWSLFITPQDDNSAKINADNSVKASLLAKGVDGKAIEGNYSIGSFMLDGLIDLSTAARIDHEYQLNKVPKKEFNNLLLSLFAHDDGSFKNREDFEKFRTVLAASFPILSFLKQSIAAA